MISQTNKGRVDGLESVVGIVDLWLLQNPFITHQGKFSYVKKKRNLLSLMDVRIFTNGTD
jgi:hypothetical protein